MRIAPNAKCQRVLVLALWLVSLPTTLVVQVQLWVRCDVCVRQWLWTTFSLV